MSIAVRKPRPQAVSETARLFADDVLAGLAADPKRLPPKYFYDQAGSELFQRITALPEYYPTRTEVDILEAHSGAIAKLVPPDAALVEFGASSAVKARILLRTAPQFAAYVPVDISGEFPPDEIAQLQQEFPRLKVAPVTADFSKSFKLPQILGLRPRVGFFPGSTIGNFEPHEANALMRQAATLLGPGALFIVGIDLVKDPDILTAAYNDGAGVTAAFNLNLLTRNQSRARRRFRSVRFSPSRVLQSGSAPRRNAPRQRRPPKGSRVRQVLRIPPRRNDPYRKQL